MSHFYIRNQFQSILLLAAFLLASPRLGAVTINAVQDTYISSASPTQSFAGDQYLSVGPQTMSFVKFLLTSLPPDTTDTQIVKATLWLWVSQATPNPFGSVAVYRVNSDWNGTGVTYATRPSYTTSGGTLGSFGGLGYYIEVDVTKQVKVWVGSPSSNYGLVILPNGSATNVLFDSKENSGTSHQPILDITWVPKPSTPTSGQTFGVCTSFSRDGSSCGCTTLLSRTVVCNGASCVASAATNGCSGSSNAAGNFGPPASCGSCCVCI